MQLSWADLALILWAAGLRVTAAWCIATETDSALKEGKLCPGHGPALVSAQTHVARDGISLTRSIYQVEEEVRPTASIECCHFEDSYDPQFSAMLDYQLAAYARGASGSDPI